VWSTWRENAKQGSGCKHPPCRARPDARRGKAKASDRSRRRRYQAQEEAPGEPASGQRKLFGAFAFSFFCVINIYNNTARIKCQFKGQQKTKG